MFFYKVTGILTDEKWIEENNDRRIMQKRARDIQKNTADFNKGLNGSGYCFVSYIDDAKADVCMMSRVTCTDIGYYRGFLKKVGIEADDISLEEITIRYVISMARRADSNDYIEDDDEPFDVMQLPGMNRFFRTEYEEVLLDEHTDKKKLYDTARKMMVVETLERELDRIYAGKKTPAAGGHPVHYIVEADKNETKKMLAGTVLQALHDNGRISSRRFILFETGADESVCESDYELLYKTCGSGAIVVRYNTIRDTEDDEYASIDMDTVNLLCETMNKYRNKVLTIFCFPRACEKIKKMFFDKLGSVSFIEIREDKADYTRALEYLRNIAGKNGIRTDKDLTDKIDTDDVYLPDELDALFDEWYSLKLKTKVFPQYRDISSCRKEAFDEKPKGSAYDELEALVGLSEAKSVIKKAIDYYNLQRVFREKGLKPDRVSMHMVFTGNPGTAKTTVARLFARIMKENGLLSKGHLVEVGRGDLVGKYVGWTAAIVKKRFEAAKGGVLFIDEAYSLVDDRGGSFGDEAINTIVQEMENCREDLVVIFAGYPKEMEGFIKKNPGLRSRIAFHVPFSDYDTDELCDIARHIGDLKGITFTEAAMNRLADVFEGARKQEDFGNGRYVRNIIEISRMNQASRIAGMDFDRVTKKVLTSLDEQDIEIPAIYESREKRRIGFAC